MSPEVVSQDDIYASSFILIQPADPKENPGAHSYSTALDERLHGSHERQTQQGAWRVTGAVVHEVRQLWVEVDAVLMQMSVSCASLIERHKHQSLHLWAVCHFFSKTSG